ncbi:MAG TPA: MoxR family ATPase [Acidimicrobiales bacterium]
MARQEAMAARTVAGFADLFEAIVENIDQVIQGKEQAIRLALVGLVSEGHLLIEDVPGIGKTSLAKALARSIHGEWHRIQFTPDLLPSDVTGVTVYNRQSATFTFRPGAIFANLVLADEINRASPKTQAALLEAMEERQVTVDTTTHRLPSPFMVIATQNPVEHEGTYPLPESQLDRFLLRIRMGYPDRGAEIAMLDAHGDGSGADSLEPVVGPSDIQTMIEVTKAIHVAPTLKGYMVDLAAATRRHPALTLGMSPRAALALQRASRGLAASLSRDYVVPDDIKAMVVPVLEHRLVLSADAQLGGSRRAEILAEVLAAVPIPAGRIGG